MRKLLSTFTRDESGQDLIEYALLTGFIGLAGVAVFTLLGQTLHDTYIAWDTAGQALWEPPPPM